MHGGDNPGSMSSNSVCHQTENTWAASTKPCAKLIWYQPCGCGSSVLIFLCLPFCREDWNLPWESPSVPPGPAHNLYSPSVLFTCKLSCCLSSLSPTAVCWFPFPQHFHHLFCRPGELVSALTLCGLLNFLYTSGDPANLVLSLPTPDLPQQKETCLFHFLAILRELPKFSPKFQFIKRVSCFDVMRRSLCPHPLL